MKILSTGIFALIASSGLMFAPDTATGDAPAGETPATPEPPVMVTLAQFLRDHPIIETLSLELKKIVITEGTQPRVAISDDVIKEYSDTIQHAEKAAEVNPFDTLPDDKLPQVFRDPTGRCVLADGFHRYGAHKNAKAKEMKVAIREGTARDALLFSLGTNKDHGVQRTNKDKARAVKLAVNDPEWSLWTNTEIARLCGVSEFMVRDARPATKSPTVRKVINKSGKASTINTGGIGKGKGGGAKGKKAAAKKAGKGGKAATGADAPPAGQTAAQELDKQLQKIATAIGGAEGGKIRSAVHDGSLKLSPREIRDWAAMDDKKIKQIAPLVTGGARMSPTKAFDLVTSELSEKVVTDLHNRALGNGGTFEFETEDVKITVKHKKK